MDCRAPDHGDLIARSSDLSETLPLNHCGSTGQWSATSVSGSCVPGWSLDDDDSGMDGWHLSAGQHGDDGESPRISSEAGRGRLTSLAPETPRRLFLSVVGFLTAAPE